MQGEKGYYKQKKNEKGFYTLEFDDRVVKAQKAAVKKEWECFVRILEKGGKELLLDKPFDVYVNTPIHAVARAGEAEILRKLLQMLPQLSEEETEEKLNIKEALRKKNEEGNTVLHEVALIEQDRMIPTLDTIMEFAAVAADREFQPLDLLKLQNNEGETPAFRAARFGNLRFLKRLKSKYCLIFRSQFHFPPRKEKEEDGHKIRPVLHSSSLNLKFEVAVWLLENVDKNLAKELLRKENKKEEKKDKGVTCLQLLSRMQMAFKTQDNLGMSPTRKFIYYMLPDEGYEAELEELDDDAGNNLFKNKRDVESNQYHDGTLNRSASSAYYAFWKFLAKVLYCCPISEIWERKKRHKFAERLAELLLENEESWKECGNIPSFPFDVSPKFPANVTEWKKDIELKDRLKKKIEFNNDILKKQLLIEKDIRILGKDETDESDDNGVEKKGNNGNRSQTWGTPIFMAAVYGNIEVVKMIVDKFPEAISHVNEEGYNILHLAVKHRQLEIYEYLAKSPAFEALKARITQKDGRTILHQAATMEFYREQNLPGVAYQLQDELEWYDRVRSVVPIQYLMHGDKDQLTAGDLLDIEHAEMHAQAKEWMKETAQSCSTVAVLIAGVVFAAAYAIPGGTQNGRPALKLRNSAFRIFTIMDVVALACSLGSVVMFLSILTSSFDLWVFHKSLPRKLKFGFIFLFIGLITTMLAFAATILLTIRLEGNKKTTTFTYSLAFVIVSVFGLTQFPLYKMTEDMVKTCSKFLKKVSGRQ